MQLTITTTHEPATDLGFLLYKHPDRFQSFSLSFGDAHVFYPEANAQTCSATLVVDVDPVRLVRRADWGGRTPLTQYVNDRPYVASSFLSVAISRVFGSALAGTSRDRPELVGRAIPLEAELAVVRVRGGIAFVQRLFEPLGYEVHAVPLELDDVHPEWGASAYYTVRLRGSLRLSELLSHLYVLIPVLDDHKHYFVAQAELEKLLAHGAGWLGTHPEREEIARRYLERRNRLVSMALAQLVEDDPDDADEDETKQPEVERPLRLHDQRLDAVTERLAASGATSVLDLGCGEGRLLQRLLKVRQFERILGMDVSQHALVVASRRLRLDRMSESKRARLDLVQGSLVYRDARLHGFDAAAIVEVIEHLDEGRLRAFTRAVFEFARPGLAIVTTPNREYNALFEGLAGGKLRHRDHRFEWTRSEFESWGDAVGERHGYDVEYHPLGDVDPDLGGPSQMAVFDRRDAR